MPSITSAKGKVRGKPVDRVEAIDGASDSDSDSDSGSVAGSDARSTHSGEQDQDDQNVTSDSDALDSDSPRKRRRTTPAAASHVEPKIIKSAFNVPSRITRKPQAAPKVEAAPPSDPEPEPESRVTAPLDANTTFDSLGLRPWLVQSLANMAIKRPTAIQRESIPMLLKGRDCIGGSRTGSGKTVAFAAPILQKWAENPSAIFAVILTPTRCVLSVVFC